MDQHKKQSPIFIVGTPRSGTTLIAKILGRHSRLFMPGETHFFDDIYSRKDDAHILDIDTIEEISVRLYDLYDRYYEPDDQQRIEKLFSSSVELKEQLSGCKSYSDIFNYFMSIQMEVEGKKRWGNNAPRDLFCIDDILDFYPDAKIIVCVRDVRAFLLSYQGKWKVTGDEHVERLKKLYHPVITSLLWKASMKLVPDIRRKVNNDNYIIVKYEEIVTNPGFIIKRICKIIGESFEADMLNINTHNSSNKSTGKGIFSTSIGRWKTDLKPEEIAISQFIGKKQLINLDYGFVKSNASFISILICFITALVALWRALDANKAMRGPLLPYLFKRIAALVRS